MTKAITFNLILEEAGLLGAPGGDPNTESSFGFIPGSALRGALAAAWLRAGLADDSQFHDLFLNGRVRYLNAYPRLEERLRPTPRSWAIRKDGVEAEDDDYVRDDDVERLTPVYDRVDDDRRAEVEADLPEGVKDAFVTIDAPPPGPAARRRAAPARVDFEIAVHTARNREYGRARENDPQSALFRYRALARDQAFAGVIVADDDVDLTQLNKLLGADDGVDLTQPEKLLPGTLLLGKSQKAGYGLTRVEAVADAADWREIDGPRPGDVAAGEMFIVRLAGDAILYEPGTGRPTTDIRHSLPGGPDGYDIVHSFAAASWVGGFNKQWGLPLSQQWATRMGSVWVLKANGPFAAAEMRKLEQTGIGMRTTEGFGRVIFEPAGPVGPIGLGKSESIMARKAATATGHADLLQRMNERLVRAELDRLLVVAVNELAGKSRGHLSRSQLGRLQVRIRHEADTANFDDFTRYLDGTTRRKSADDQFRKFTVGGRNFRTMLGELVANPPTVWGKFVPEGWQPPKIGDKAFLYNTNELSHAYTVRFIANLCRQLSKQGGDQ